MNTEPYEITQAREHMKAFERDMLANDAIHHLLDGFDLLTAVTESKTAPRYKELAANIGATYAAKLLGNIPGKSNGRLPTRSDMDHMFDLLDVVEAYPFGDKAASSNRVHRARFQLFTLYIQMLSKEEKMEVLEELEES